VVLPILGGIEPET
jgi:hypothetical protein